MSRKQARFTGSVPLTDMVQAARIWGGVCAAVMGIIAVMLFLGVETVYIADRNALKDFDFSSRAAYVGEHCFDSYPGALYTPDDFASGLVTDSPAAEDDGSAGCYTYRLVLTLEKGKVYGLSGYSATYAQTIWVDGVLLSSVGVPGDSLATTVPKTNYSTQYFAAQSEQTEIVIHRSDFVHARSGQLFPQYLGEQSLISQIDDRIKLMGAVTVGAMLMAAAFFFCIFLFFRERRQFLWFALSCLLITVRTLSIDHKLGMVFLPDLNWELAHKLEYLATIGFLFSFFMYVNRMFERKISHALNIYGIIVVCFYFAMVLVTPSTVYTKFLPYMHGAALTYVLASIFLLTRDMAKKRKNRMPEHYLILAGTIGYIILTLLDLFHYITNNNLYQDWNLMQAGVMVFAFANVLALVLSFTRTEAELNEAKRNKREMEEANRLLERLNRIKIDFLSNISHEIRTPLTVMSGYAQRARRQIEAGTVDEDTRRGLLTISMEAQRLAMLAQQFLDTSIEAADTGLPGPADPARILKRAAALCGPILEKNGNRLEVYRDENCPPVKTNEDMILEVLVNLCVNANRHTENDTVSLTVEREGDVAKFRLEDNGEGISPELLPRVFERGVSGDGESGLGLFICRDVLEAHGGTIWIESAPGAGTCAAFTLPLYDLEGDANA